MAYICYYAYTLTNNTNLHVKQHDTTKAQLTEKTQTSSS